MVAIAPLLGTQCLGRDLGLEYRRLRSFVEGNFYILHNVTEIKTLSLVTDSRRDLWLYTAMQWFLCGVAVWLAHDNALTGKPVKL